MRYFFAHSNPFLVILQWRGSKDQRRSQSVGGLTADCRHRDMRHWRIRFGAVPVSLAVLDMDDIADGDLALFLLRGNHASTRCDLYDLVAVVGMPSGGGAFAEVHHVAAVVIRTPIADDRLPCPAHRSPSPTGDRGSAVHRLFRQII